MEIVKFTFNPIQENTYLVIDEDKEAVIIDPGCYFKEEKTVLKRYIDDNNLHLCALLNTHAHLDHVMGNAFIKREYGVDIYMHKTDMPTLEMAAGSAALYGMDEFENPPQPDCFTEEGTILEFGKLKFKVILGPGHSPGHVAFYAAEENILINGDILFKGSYGRVDLPGGNFDDLKTTIIDKLFKLPEETLVYTGHGDETTIGEEKKNNPILW